MGIPHSGFATIANSSTHLRVILANGVSLPSAVINAIKYTMIQTAMKIPTAHKPRLQFAVRSSRSFRQYLSIPYFVSLVIYFKKKSESAFLIPDYVHHGKHPHVN
jgi:hypothetical protein